MKVTKITNVDLMISHFFMHKIEELPSMFTQFMQVKKITSANHVENHFEQNNYLKNHIFIVHEGRKDCTCDPCGKIFFRENSLKIHIHNEYKHHKCKSCEKTF